MNLLMGTVRKLDVSASGGWIARVDHPLVSLPEARG